MHGQLGVPHGDKMAGAAHLVEGPLLALVQHGQHLVPEPPVAARQLAVDGVDRAGLLGLTRRECLDTRIGRSSWWIASGNQSASTAGRHDVEP